MSNGNNENDGIGRHWKLAGVGGVVVAVVYSLLTGSGIGASALIGILFFGVAGFVMGRNGGDAGDASTGAPTAAAAPAPATPAVEATEETVVDAVVETVEEVAEAVADAASEEQPLIKPSTALPGQAELAERKGTWRYDANKASA